MSKGDKPIEKYRVGSVSIAVFENEVGKGDDAFTARNYVIQKNYMKDDEWKSTNQFNEKDLDTLDRVLTNARLRINQIEDKKGE